MNYADLYQELYHEANRRTRQPADADDLVQQTMLRIIENGSGPDGRSSLRTWAYSAMRFGSYNFYRLKSRQTEEPCDFSSDDFLDQLKDERSPDRQVQAMQALQSVPDLLAQSATGKEYQEIAADEGIPIGTVRSRINRHRQSFKKEVGQ